MTMPSEDEQQFEETILRGNITMDNTNNLDGGGDQNVLKTGNQSPDSPSVPDSSSSSVIMKSNLSSHSNKQHKQQSEIHDQHHQQHRVTFSESNSVKLVESNDVRPVISDAFDSAVFNAIHTNVDGTAVYSTATGDFCMGVGEGGRGWTGGGGGGRLHSPQADLPMELQSKIPTQPIIRLNRSPSTDSHENPFQTDGPLSKKADYIVRNSTISRTELKIADPDQTKAEEQQQEVVDEQVVAIQSAPVQHASPPSGGSDIPVGPTRPNDINVKENGKLEEPLTPQSVEVEVGQANASQPEAQKAEEVKLPKDQKCKCCVVQ